jgi:hypothetical protein
MMGILLLVIIGSSYIYYSYRDNLDNSSAVAQATRLATATKTPKPTPTPDDQATRRAKPTATAPILSDIFPTATADDPGTTTERREKNCPGYAAWIAGENDRIYRANVVVDLLDNTLDDDFEGVDFRAMKREIRFLIAAERDSLPPDELEFYREETITLLKTIQDLVMAAEDKDWNAYNRAIDEYNAFLDGNDAENDDIFSEACG